MTNEDMIRMAREAGGEITSFINYDYGEDVVVFYMADLARFARLVYEATFRDANIAASKTILDAAVLEEREACAKVCESLDETDMRSRYDYRRGVIDCVDAIRARSKE